MALAVWPDSPQPAGQSMSPDCGEIAVRFDSGVHHATTTYQRPLYSDWTIPWTNIPQAKRDKILGFVNSMKAGAQTFLVKHHKDFRVNSVLVASAGWTDGGTMFLYDTNSYFIRADTTTIGSLFSTLSGYVTLGSEYQYEQDTGILTANSFDSTDVWRANSMQYFRKVYITRNYNETGILEGQYTGRITFDEVS